MTGRPSGRAIVVSAALILAGLAELAGAVLIFSQSDRLCSVDLFGLRVPEGLDCYWPISRPVLVALGWSALGIAIALRPSLFARPAALVAALGGLSLVPPVLSESDVLNTWTLALALLAAVPFLVAVPTGPTARSAVQRLWVAALVASGLLAAFDVFISGLRKAAHIEPQLSFVVVALAILGAGLLAARMKHREMANA